MKNLERQLQQAKQASADIATLSAAKKKELLLGIANCLLEHKSKIIAANKKDIATTKKKGANASFIDRLTLSDKGFDGMVAQLRTVANLSDVYQEVIESRTLANGIQLKKLRFPIGVIAMIYESRPNVTVDVAGLCLKSGNAVILKGGSEALLTNTKLVECIHSVLNAFGLSQAIVTFLTDLSHEEVGDMLERSDLIDVVIPRGSYALTSAVAAQSRIPVLYHEAGGARMYIDQSADLNQALSLCVNSKTNRTGVCNALDAVLVHESVAAKLLPKLDTALTEKGFAIRASLTAKKYMKHATLATKEDFETEFLDSILAVKVVRDATEALTFITEHTRHHTEVLVAEDAAVIERFIMEVDAAGLMINCASRFHDGGEFEMGAEMGIATGKIHARGPVGVRELTTYKWIAYGSGQTKK